MPPSNRLVTSATIRRQRETMRAVAMILDHLFFDHLKEGTQEMQPPLIPVDDQLLVTARLHGGGGRAVAGNPLEEYSSKDVASDIINHEVSAL